jgi:hypothetical protein
VPDVQGLNLCDNRLTDQSLVPLIQAVQAKPALVSELFVCSLLSLPHRTLLSSEDPSGSIPQ